MLILSKNEHIIKFNYFIGFFELNYSNLFFFKKLNILLFYYSSLNLKILRRFYKKKKFKFRFTKSFYNIFLSKFIKKGYKKFIFKKLINLLNFFSYETKITNFFKKSIDFIIIEKIIRSYNLFFKYSFHAYSKQLKKYTRGKIGKYRLVFNFLHKHKRLDFKLSLIKKNLKYFFKKSFFKKLLIFFKFLINKPQKTLFFKLIKFINLSVLKKNYFKVLVQSS